jgi:mannobiose 2-epimerase
MGGCATDRDAPSHRSQLAAEIDTALTDQLLTVWYPRVLDSTHGGYRSTFSHDWTPVGEQNKMIVTQARHVWTLSEASSRFPDRRYAQYAQHGVDFLHRHMWDQTHGGFYRLVTRAGAPLRSNEETFIKRAYGQAFAIYGLASYVEATGDSAALSLAKEAFHWLDAHSHDAAQGGYFQYMQRDGTPFTNGYEGTPPKDYNSSIHILEALTELYQVWPDSLVRTRLEEMYHVVRDTMVADRGFLKLYFERDWTPVTYDDSAAAAADGHRLDHVTFGHDVETAFLLLEAAHVLGTETATEPWGLGKRMVDHALANGWDSATGGLYNRGRYRQGDDRVPITDSSKSWWAQAEMLNTLHLMADRYPDDPQRYGEKFEKQWVYVQTHLIDETHGGWYPSGADEDPTAKTANKAGIWKGNYHTARALMNCLDRLRGGKEERAVAAGETRAFRSIRDSYE